MLNSTHYRDSHGRAVISKQKAHALGFFALSLLVLGLYHAHGARATQSAANADALERAARNVTSSEPLIAWPASPYVIYKDTGVKRTRMGTLSHVTAYTSRVKETDASPCISADSSNICELYARGEKVCASNDYALGTRLHVSGLGTCTVHDRMNKRFTGTGRVDWYMGYDLKAARAIGLSKRVVTVAD